MVLEKRNSRSYKCVDTDYKAAMKRAKKEKVHLANLIELIVKWYAAGLEVKLVKSK